MSVRAQSTQPMTILLVVVSVLATVAVSALVIGVAMRGHSCRNEPQQVTYNGTTRTVHQVVCT